MRRVRGCQYKLSHVRLRIEQMTLRYHAETGLPLVKKLRPYGLSIVHEIYLFQFLLTINSGLLRW